MKLARAFLVLLVIILAGCSKEHSAIPSDDDILGSIVKPGFIDEYTYPILPGTPEWAALSSHDEMLEALELPDSVLHSITTWGLFETCINYPLYGDFAAFNDQVSFINYLEQTNKGFKELFLRDDAPLVILYFYRHWDITLYENFLKRNFIELVIGSDKFTEKLDKRQLLYLVSVALDMKQRQKINYPGTTPPYSYFVMANSMLKYDFEPFVEYCARKKENPPDGYYFWRINSSCEKIEDYSHMLLYR